MEKTIGEALWEEGWNKGMAEGKRKGYRLLLRELLSERFGPLSEEIQRRIETCEDLDRLTAASKQVLVRLDKLEDLQL